MGQKGSAKNTLNLSFTYLWPLKTAKVAAFIIAERNKSNLLNSLRIHSLYKTTMVWMCLKYQDKRALGFPANKHQLFVKWFLFFMGLVFIYP